MKYLVTGGCGFIGSNFVEYLLQHDSDAHILNLDKYTEVSNDYLSVKYADDDRYDEHHIDLAYPIISQYYEELPDVVVHFAAESHVDRSCENVQPFIDSNITGTMNIVYFCIKRNIKLIYVSTDEVYGSLTSTELPFTENSRINPRNPYAASKASGEFILQSIALANDYTNYIITRCSNNFGKLQDKTKLIPVAINNLLNDTPIPIYGKGEEIRDWIHVLDHCDAIYKLIHNNTSYRIYNIGANNELRNIDIAEQICHTMNIGVADGIKFVADPRGSAHDFRYAINSDNMRRVDGWIPTNSTPFDIALDETIQWYCTDRLIFK